MQGQTRLSLIEQAKFTNDSPDEVRLRLKALLDAGEIRLRDIEKITSFKSPTISQHLNGTYEGDVEKLDDAMMRFYRNWIANNAIIQTKIVGQIHDIMTLAWRRK